MNANANTTQKFFKTANGIEVHSMNNQPAYRGPARTCCICGAEFYGYGNNPEPAIVVEDYKKDRCCDSCNENVVIPARLFIMDLIDSVSNDKQS